MRIYPRGKKGILWLDVTVDGERITRSAGTTERRQAEEWAAEVIRDAWRVRKLGEAPRVTWGTAVLDWIEKYGRERRSIETIKGRLRWLSKHLIDAPLSNITRARVEELMSLKRAEGVAPKKEGAPRKPVAGGTLNTYVAAVSTILHHAQRQGWIVAVPRLRKYAEAEAPINWITQDQAGRLLEELPDHLADMARFALSTGLRESRVRLLRWKQVDIARGIAWIERSESKNKRPLGVPLNEDAIALLLRRRNDHPTYVFVYKGHPVVDCTTAAWYKATKRAGLEGFRFHDLRHTWASWHVQDETPLPALQQLGGWSSYDMVLRYAHLGVDHTSAYVGASLLRDKSVTTSGEATDETANSMVPLDGIELSTFALRKFTSTPKPLILLDAERRKKKKTA